MIREPASRKITFVLAAAFAVLASNSITAAEPKEPSKVNPALAAHQARLAEPHLQRVSERVFAAISYGVANIAFVVGDSGIVVFDTGTNVEDARAALAALRAFSKLPIAAIVYSHGHADHVGGARAFLTDTPSTTVPIIAGARWLEFRRQEAIPRTPGRAFYLSGVMLPAGPTGNVGAGTGPMNHRGRTQEYIPPSRSIAEQEELTLAGVRVVLRPAPGDEIDGLAAWLPDDRVLLAGDAAYRHLPAASTPRFASKRNIEDAIDTIDWMRSLGSKSLVPGHLAIVAGEREVHSFLTDFRDCLQFMHDQTIRAVRRGLGPEETALELRRTIPKHLLGSPNLGEFYHRFEWVIRGLYTSEAGWFSGDAIDFVRPSPQQRAERIIDLAGGTAQVVEAARVARANGDRGWAAELLQYVVLADRGNATTRADLASVLREIAYETRSANERNYLLTESLVLDGVMSIGQLPLGRSRPDELRPVDDLTLLRRLATRLDPVKSRHVVLPVNLTIKDAASWSLTVRHGVLEVQRGSHRSPELSIELNRETWLQIAGENLRFVTAFEESRLLAESLPKLRAFATLFDGEV